MQVTSHTNTTAKSVVANMEAIQTGTMAIASSVLRNRNQHIIRQMCISNSEEIGGL